MAAMPRRPVSALISCMVFNPFVSERDLDPVGPSNHWLIFLARDVHPDSGVSVKRDAIEIAQCTYAFWAWLWSAPPRQDAAFEAAGTTSYEMSLP